MIRSMPRVEGLRSLPRVARTRVSLGLLAGVLLAALVLAGCGTESRDTPDEAELSGGATTVFEASSNAFRLPAPNLSAVALARHREGDTAFDRKFVTAPAAPFGGLGPVFNNSSCSGCHVGNGRGAGSLLLRISAGGRAADGGPAPVPGFGLQVQDRAVLGRPAEARLVAAHFVQEGAYDDGTPYALDRPVFQLVDGYAPLTGIAESSPRVAPAVFGLGLLEAVPEAEILARADPDDRDGDGISGRPNHVGPTRARAPACSAASAGRRTSRTCASSPPAPTTATWASPRRSSRPRAAAGQPRPGRRPRR